MSSPVGWLTGAGRSVLQMGSRPEVTSSKLAAFAAGCVAGGALAAAAAAVFMWSATKANPQCSSAAQKALAQPLPWEAPCSTSPAKAASATAAMAVSALTDSTELRLEQFSRNRQFFGEEAQAKIERAFVVVVGVGGVGSHAAHMLARAGVARLRIVDFDNVSLSSLNRHAVATRADVGTPKVLALKRALAGIVPSCVVEAVQAVFEASRADELLGGSPDMVLDCIDDKDTKLALLDACYRKGLRVVCSLGAGGRADPTRICIADLAAVRGENLSAALRLIMRRDGLCGFHGIPTGSARRRAGDTRDKDKDKAKDGGKAVKKGKSEGAARPGADDGEAAGGAGAAPVDAGRNLKSGMPPDGSDSDSGSDADADVDAETNDAEDAGRRSTSATASASAASGFESGPGSGSAAASSGGRQFGPANRPPRLAPEERRERTAEELAAITAERQARKQAVRDRTAAVRARGFSGMTPAAIAAGEAAADPMTGITCVFSAEPPRVNLLPLEMAEGESPSDFGALPGFRVRVIPVLGCIPAMFGQAAAAYALCELAGPEHSLTARGGAGGAASSLLESGPLGHAGIIKLLSRFVKREQMLYRCVSGSDGSGSSATLLGGTGNPLGHEDVSFLMNDVWRQRSGMSPQRAGHKASFVELCRWRLDRPSVPSNLVAVAEYEGDRMHAACEAGLAAAIAELRERAAKAAKTAGAGTGAGAGALPAAPADCEPYLPEEQVDALSRWQQLHTPHSPFADVLGEGRRPHWLEALLARHHAAAVAKQFGEQATQYAAARLAWVRSQGYQ